MQIKKCSIETCDRSSSERGGGLGFCAKHWLQQYRSTEKGRQVMMNSAKKHRTTLKGRYSAAKGDAKKRKIEWNLTFEEYSKLVEERKDKCSYCGNTITHNGGHLDRMNNRLGYILFNCLIACAGCNKLKSDTLTPKETAELVSLLKKLRNTEDIWNGKD